MNPAIENLTENQQQLDADGIMVGVSRQALDETLAIMGEMYRVLNRICELNRDGRIIARTLGDAEAILSKYKS